MSESLNVIYGLHAGDGKIRYVGMTRNGVEDRLYGHLAATRIGSEYAVHRWIRKRGANSIKAEVLESLSDPKMIPEREKFWIKELKTYVGDGERGLNMTRGGEGGRENGLRTAHIRFHLPRNIISPYCGFCVETPVDRPSVEPMSPTEIALISNHARWHVSRDIVKAECKHCIGPATPVEVHVPKSQAEINAISNHTRWHVNRDIVSATCSLCEGDPTPITAKKIKSPSESAKFGSHVRWHVNRSTAKEGCTYCATT